MEESSPAKPAAGPEPVGSEAPPGLGFPVVGVGASAGGLEAFIEMFEAMPGNTGMAFVLILHLPPDAESMVAGILGKHARMPVLQITDGMRVEPDHIYVIRPGHTVSIRDGMLRLGKSLDSPRHGHPVDDFFRSLAEEQRERAIAVVMSGMGSNGTAGAEVIKAAGGVVIVQDPDSAKYPLMPRHVIDAGHADFVLKPREIPSALLSYAGHSYISGSPPEESSAHRDAKRLQEILSVLKTRTRRDFSGYKKASVLRRIHRRMSLQQTEEIGEYLQLLRQNATEASELSDDLLIHVSGFFRDPEAWEVLRRKVIMPLVTEREAGKPIRCWVAACAGGEEAYTLAMLLYEGAEAAAKTFDIKVFATDTGERSLKRARQGCYPVGIEAEIHPQRMERFFDRDGAFYRIKKELRELVVFAPQNIIQDPPFSKIDICTCRNLLIYLEPDTQRRVLTLLHFSLREGGGLFLGNSETVAGADDLFDVVDKRARIYRRIGPSHPGSLEFSLPPQSTIAEIIGSKNPQVSIAHLTTRMLLEKHTPPAVTVNRHFDVVYYHGDTGPYLGHPPGEPTRDVISLAREGVRAAVRSALYQASNENRLVTARGGLIEIDQHRFRVEVSATPLDSPLAPIHYLVTFHHFPEPDLVSRGVKPDAEDASALRDELDRVRDELQSTIEELQSSNEEMRASNEETMSINEELQSTNEELETSKEELQSLNEELTTVNVQLQAKMEELEATSSDLASLLSSTDIAVLFLDRQFRIRRFTPAVRDLLDLIPSDEGRPLSDLARKFSDPDLLSDCQAVLDRLIPLEYEVHSESGRTYVRRVLPYRTATNRINGVVITFMEVSELKRIENALRESEQALRLVLEGGAADQAMILTDADGRITTWNLAAEQVLGWSQREALHQHIHMIYPAERRHGQWQHESAVAEQHGRASEEAWYLRKNGSRFWGSGVLTAIRGEDGQLRGYFKVIRDETARKQAESELAATLVREQAARQEAEAMSKLKDEFLASLSHELRTPLSAILMWSQMLQKADLDQSERAEGLQVIEHSAQAQRRLLDDLLDTSRVQTGKVRLERKLVSLGTLIHKAVDAVLPIALAKKLTLDASIDADLGMVWADPDRLHQVLGNLLINAVKFTPERGLITVDAVREDGWLQVTVSDTGLGIDAELLPKLFTPFVQASTPGFSRSGGMGLGLAICKELVELHGGTVRAHSAGPGQGTTMVVRLPMPPPDPALTEAAQESPPSEPLDPDLLAGANVLIVEDDAQTRTALERMLKQHGAAVTSAATATEALKVFESARPDLIMSDLGMPEQDGFELIEAIRAIENQQGWPVTPAIALTAFASREDRRRAHDAGYHLHVSKPVDCQPLLSHLARLLAHAEKTELP